jgi:hypothetical protein
VQSPLFFGIIPLNLLYLVYQILYNKYMTIVTEAFEPIIIDDCLDQAHILSAYRTMAMAPHVLNTKTNKRDLVQPDEQFGYISYNKNPDKFVLDRIMELVQSNTDIPVNTPDFHFAKYAKSSGHRPQLYPHYDVHLKVPHLTLSIQIESSFPWTMFIDGKPYTLKDNQGLLFSGTHQIHWRDNVDFGEYDYSDVLLSQFSVAYDENLSEEHYGHMEDKKSLYWDKWQKA